MFDRVVKRVGDLIDVDSRTRIDLFLYFLEACSQSRAKHWFSSQVISHGVLDARSAYRGGVNPTLVGIHSFLVW